MNAEINGGAPNALATRAQLKAERDIARIERAEPVIAARQKMRAALLADPGAATIDGRVSLDRALDQWMRFYMFFALSRDVEQPTLFWAADNSPREWFGQIFPGDMIAGDNPDNSNRVTYLDGSSSYELTGRYGTPMVGQFSLNIEVADPVAIGLGEHLAVLTNKTIKADADGGFRITIDADPAGDRPNHMQVRPGLLTLSARDSRSDWVQQATVLTLRLIDGPGLERLDEDARIAAIAEGLPGFVERWSRFKDRFFGFPEPNRVILPERRESEGGWGYIGGGRFQLREDEALIVTTHDGDADYTGVQITDPWTMRPETVLRTSSLNKHQAKRDADGRYTYVIAAQDPGVANWLDTCGLSEGWFQLRWQNVPAGGNPTAEPVKRVKLSELDSALPDTVARADLAYRQAQIRDRVAGMALRTREVMAD